jgi:predicted SnoaL-like aldol condensation-catalyzing enzyme
MPQSYKESAVAFLREVAAGQVREAYARYVGSGFRHHNPFFRGDAASLMNGMEQNARENPGKVLQIHMAIEEGNRVAVFSHVRQEPGDRGGAVVHLFRFDGDRIAELWDIGQPIPEETVNENGPF